MNWPMLLGSLAGVVALAGAAHLLGLGGASIEDGAHAMRLAESLLPGFQAISVNLAIDTAEVTGADGRRAILRRLGARFVAELRQ